MNGHFRRESWLRDRARLTARGTADGMARLGHGTADGVDTARLTAWTRYGTRHGAVGWYDSARQGTARHGAA